MAVGIICEYNPFHNGHLYHLEKVKELAKDEEIILVLGGNFLQRGNVSVMDKYEKTSIALHYGIDLVVELPFIYATQSADVFAEGAIKILNALKCDKVVFGTESNDVEKLTSLAKIQLYDNKYGEKVKTLLDEGYNFPTAMSLALQSFEGDKVNTPNDLLALSYIKEIIRNNYNITPISIKRTNNYHDKSTTGEISSAASIREKIKRNENIDTYVPSVVSYNIDYKNYDDNYFKLLKYKILTEKESIKKYQTVNEGIENKIVSSIRNCYSLDDLVDKIKSKRYTYNRISRMLTHILTSFTKEDAKDRSLSYIRILGFDEKGKKYLNKLKKGTDIPFITNVNKKNIKFLETELKTDSIYYLIREKNIDVYSYTPVFINEKKY